MESNQNQASCKGKKLSLATLVCGILAAGLCWFAFNHNIWFFSMISVLFGIAAIIIYTLAIKKADANLHIAVAGLVLGIVGLVVGLVFSALWLYVLFTTGTKILGQFKGLF
ncbi:MAG: hypothetical protein ACYCX2_10440 [Christensenellales bacterium]